MITSLRLGNFKAFGPAQEIPIRPITLIFGPNSAGKSSILHSLLFAREAFEKGKVDVHYTDAGGEAVDLGGFRQFVFKRQTDQSVEWSAEIPAMVLNSALGDLSMHAASGRITALFRLPQAVEEYLDDGESRATGATRSRPDVSIPILARYDLEAGGKVLFSISRRFAGLLRVERFDLEHPVMRRLLRDLLLAQTWKTKVSEEDVSKLEAEVSSNLRHLEVHASAVLPNRARWSEAMESKLKQDAGFIPTGMALFPRVVTTILDGLARTLREALSDLSYLGPLRSYPARHFALAQSRDSEWRSGGGFAWDILREDEQVRDKVNQWLGSDHLQTRYQIGLRRLIAPREAGGQIEKALQDIYQELTTTKPFEVRHEPGVLDNHPHVVDFSDVDMEEYASRIINSMAGDTHLEGFNDLALLDLRTKTVVSHRDVGIGVSQVLPVLVSAFAMQRKVLAVEQPEIHLHPALQADLADVFIQSALGELSNNFLLETHSEHLLLRVMRRMRETQEKRLPDGIPAIHPHDVAVLYVNPTPNGSVVMELPLNERGELVKPWPGGFFEEGLRETFA